MKSVVEFFIRNPIAANLLVLLILVFGYMGLNRSKSTLFPAATEKFIKIQVVYPGASPEEIEEGVVLKIEENLRGLTGIERVSSVSSENAAMIDVEMLTGYNIDIILQNVKNAVGQISSFPVGMESPQIFKVENKNFAFSFALSGDVELHTLKQFARKCEDELRATGIVSKITLSGFPKEEIEITFRESDLIKYQISFAEATLAVRNANIEVTGGRIKGSEEELLLRARNKGYFAEDLLNIPIKNTADGAIIYLYQLANIKDQWEDSPVRSFLNTKPSVVVAIDNTDDEDIITITNYMNKYIEEYNAKNTLVKADIIRDGSITLRQRIDLLTVNGIIGFFLVLLALGLFLNPRIAFWVASSIPVAFAGLFMLAPMLGITINVISLFGMIIVVGILVDDGIVISENIYAYYEQGKSKYEAALYGTLDVLPSVASSVLTTIAAFGTFFFLDGRLGDFFFDMAVVVSVTLLVSMVEGALVLPAHMAHSKALDKEPPSNPFEKVTAAILSVMDKFLAFIRDRLYAPALRFSLHGFQKMVPMSIIVGCLFLVISGIRGGHIKTTFFPFIERDDIQVALQMPAGTPEKTTTDWLLFIEKKAWEINDEIKKSRKDGLDIILKIERNMGPTTYQGRLSITLLDGEKRQMSVLEIGNRIRERAGDILGAENVTYGTSSPFGKPISISILGNNLAELQGAIEALKAELRAINGLKDIVDNNQQGLREINIQLTDKARQLGLNLQEIVAQVRQGFFGSEVQRLQRGRDEVRVWVRYDLQDRNNAGQLENMRIRFADGREFPLHEIATFETKRGVVSINHIDGKREVKVDADIGDKKVSVTDITTQIKATVIPKLQAQFGNTQFTFEGQSKENEKTMRSMGKVLPIVGLIMFAIILLTFRSWSQTIVVVSMIPFGFVGVGWGHWLLDAQISFFSVLGMVALVGVMVNDSIVLVATMNDKIREGMSFDEAVYTAGISRFRAIWLTSLTTILGLGPLILEKSFQAQFLVPMAISVAFGLFVATLLSLLILPVVLKLVNRYKVYTAWLWSGELLEPTMVEPANEHRKEFTFIWWFPVILLVTFLWGTKIVGLLGLLLSYVI